MSQNNDLIQLLTDLTNADADYRAKVAATLAAASVYAQAVSNFEANPTIENAALVALAWDSFQAAMDAQETSQAVLLAAMAALSAYIAANPGAKNGGAKKGRGK